MGAYVWSIHVCVCVCGMCGITSDTEWDRQRKEYSIQQS